MSSFCWINPATNQKYFTALANDPNVPAGFVLTSGSDGARDEAVKQYEAGINNQGAGPTGYSDGDPGMRTVQPNWPNGILGGYEGGGTQAPPRWPNA